MSIYRLLLLLLTVFVLHLGAVYAENRQQHFYRNFWNPTYHAERLDYCTADKKTCGLSLANSYCKMMGYKRAKESIIDYNLGLTHYLFSSAECRGWGCNGFTLITCVGHFSHKPAPQYYYRSQRFVYPRFNQYRVDWCYGNGRGCGQRAAYSFCRRMGYRHEQYYTKEERVHATKAIGNQKLCFGEQCSGFRSITCFR